MYALDRIWHAALWDAMNRINTNITIIKVIQGLYEKIIYSKGKVGEFWIQNKVAAKTVYAKDFYYLQPYPISC